MASYPPGGDYDERLLASIPAASKAEKQEGYNVNLLDNEQNSSPLAQNPPSNLGHSNGDPEGGPLSKEHSYQKGNFAFRPLPWYRRGKWRIGILIGAIIIIGAVVGGAVGGTVGKHKTSTDISNPSGPVTSTITTGPAINSHPSTTPSVTTSSAVAGASGQSGGGGGGTASIGGTGGTGGPTATIPVLQRSPQSRHTAAARADQIL